MPHPIEASTLRILKPTGETVGTGFLVSKNLAVTCAHVVKILGAGAGDTIDIRFTGKSASTSAHVLPEYWRPDNLTDIAILQVDEVPAGVFPLRMGRASESRLKNDLYTFGYAIAADEQGIGGLGTFITLKQEGNFIQFRMHEANHGHSGAPIYDDQRGVVVGMIKKGHTGTGRNAETTFAVPSETIWQVCPPLKPIVSHLPRRNPIVEGINLLPYDYDQRIQNFLTEYLGTDTHPVPFGGRDDALKMLDTWLAETTPYLLLAAPAGRGKSALLVRWLESLKTREDLALAFVPVSIRFGTNMERVFYAALAARLAFLHGDNVPVSSETSTPVYRGLVSDYLSKPLASGRALLVVLDGLDEAADWRIKADFMPAELPAGVRVVVSARFLAGDADSKPWLSRLNWERGGLASAPPLTPLDQEGVRDVLFKTGCPLDELSRKVDIVAELYRLSAGDPLLVGLYVGDLWAKGESVTHLKPEDLTSIQPGYKGYFNRWWDDQQELWGAKKPWLEQHVRVVRSLLAGALAPLFAEDLQALAPELETDHITDAMDVLRRFVVGDNQAQGYTYSHPKLGQYFWETLSTDEQAKWEQRFLDWGEKTLQEFIDGRRNATKKKEVPAYAVSNYGAHLERSKEPIEKWRPLIHHQQWRQAWFTVEGAYDGYLQDVHRAWKECKRLDRENVKANGTVPYLIDQIRCALIEASLHSMAGNIPPQLFWPLVRDRIWTLPQAWMFIRQMPEAGKRGDAIVTLFRQLGKDQLAETLHAVYTIKENKIRARVLSDLIQYLPEMGTEAVETARMIQDEVERAEIMGILMRFLPELANETLTTAKNIQDEADRINVFSYLVKYLPVEALGQLMNEIRAVEDEWSRVQVLTEVIQYLPEEALEQALEMARTIEHAEFRGRCLSQLARRLPEITGETLDVIRAIRNEALRANTLHDLAEHLPEGALEPVLHEARTIRIKSGRAKVFCVLAGRLPGIEQEARVAIRAIRNKEKQAHLLIDLAKHRPEFILEALEAAQTVKDEDARVRLLHYLAEYVPKSTLNHLRVAAREINDQIARVRILGHLAERFPEIAGEVLDSAQEIKDDQKRTIVVSNLVRLDLKLSKEEQSQMVEMAKAIPSFWERANTLSNLAVKIPGMADEALRATQAINYDQRCYYQILEAFAQHVSGGKTAQLLATTHTIQDEEVCANLLLTLIQRAPEDQLAEILAIARSLRGFEQRALVLSELVGRLPEIASEALVTSRKIKENIERARVLSRLAKHVPTVAGEAAKTARSIQADWARGLAMGELAGNLPEFTDEAIEEAQWLDDEKSRAEILSTLAQGLPEDRLFKILETSQEIRYENYRYLVLSSLAQRIPKDQLEPLLEAAREIHDRWSRTAVLSELADRLPGIISEALTAAQEINNVVALATVHCAMAKHFPEKEMIQALAKVQTLQESWQRANLFKNLAQPLIQLTVHETYLLLEMLFSELAQRTLVHLSSDISALMPVLLHLGTEDIGYEIYSATCAISAW